MIKIKILKKEAKMPEEQTESAAIHPRRKHVYADIQEADGHYIVSFSHGPPRVFHDMEDLLAAIEEEVKKKVLADWALITEIPKQIKWEKEHPPVDDKVFKDSKKLSKAMKKHRKKSYEQGICDDVVDKKP